MSLFIMLNINFDAAKSNVMSGIFSPVLYKLLSVWPWFNEVRDTNLLAFGLL